MNTHSSRRRFSTALAALGLGGLATPGVAARSASAKVVVVGGGFAGATCARFVRRLLPQAAVTLIEADATYVACPFSNLVVAGIRSLAAQTFRYDALSAEGITVLRTTAREVDAAARTVTLVSGDVLTYDKLVLAPGIDFRWQALDGYDEAAAERMPHAWKAGVQTTLLQRQLQAMPDGGTVVMSVTAAPFRCPPGPYERASLIGRYLQQHKPRSKLLILDSNKQFSKQPLFLQAWKALYGGMVEWRGEADDGRVQRVDVAAMTLHTDFAAVRGDVVNVVPPQQAGSIAMRAGAADASLWCPIDAVSFASRLQPHMHVVGDAAIAAPMPKSAFAANAQAKVCAIQIARLLADLDAEPTTLANTCYSFINEKQAISVAGMYQNASGAFADVAGAGGISPLAAPDGLREREALQAADWFAAITREAFL